MTWSWHVDRADLFAWLPQVDDVGPVVAVLPDAAEIGMDHDPVGWLIWYRRAARACIRAAGSHVAVFAATDRRRDGEWIDKGAILSSVAMSQGRRTLWHKIVLRRDPGKTDVHRPGYTHLLAFGADHHRPGAAIPDVLPPGGHLWRDGLDIGAAAMIARWLRDVQGARCVVNPACGEGTMLTAAARLHMDVYGCDTDAARVATAIGHLDAIA